MSMFSNRRSLGRPALQLGSVSLALLLFAGAAPAQTTTPSTAPAASGAMAGNGMKLPRGDVAFLKQAAQNGHVEVEGSKLALTKSGNAQVKTFAQQMVDDHTKAGDELTALASSKGVEVPAEPSVAQRAKMKLLQSMDGDRFDRRYAETVGVSAHQDTVKLFRKASTDAKDPDVKAFAAKTLPTLEHHLEMAQQLKTATMAQKSASNGAGADTAGTTRTQ